MDKMFPASNNTKIYIYDLHFRTLIQVSEYPLKLSVDLSAHLALLELPIKVSFSFITIPFMAMLGEKYPEAQFVITGVLGPNSNAHGPNEFLHIPYAKKLTCCIASIINDFN